MPIRIGCGSWTDDAYVGVLYRPGAPKQSRLHAYTHWFERIEVNATYHAAPLPAVVAGWCSQTPPGFLFDIKLPRRFSEDPQGAAASDLASRCLAALETLIVAKKLGAFLLTLAPGFTPARHRLDELDGVAEQFRRVAPVAVELRHRGWVEGDALASTLDYFRRRRLAWVALDLPRLDAPALLPPIDEVTDPALAYMRLHGRNPHYLRAKTAEERHRYAYSAAELAEIAARVRALAGRAENVHVSVNNHSGDFAPKAALALRRELGQTVPPPLPADDAGGGQLSLLD